MERMTIEMFAEIANAEEAIKRSTLDIGSATRKLVTTANNKAGKRIIKARLADTVLPLDYKPSSEEIETARFMLAFATLDGLFNYDKGGNEELITGLAKDYADPELELTLHDIFQVYLEHIFAYNSPVQSADVQSMATICFTKSMLPTPEYQAKIAELLELAEHRQEILGAVECLDSPLHGEEDDWEHVELDSGVVVAVNLFENSRISVYLTDKEDGSAFTDISLVLN